MVALTTMASVCAFTPNAFADTGGVADSLSPASATASELEWYVPQGADDPANVWQITAAAVEEGDIADLSKSGVQSTSSDLSPVDGAAMVVVEVRHTGNDSAALAAVEAAGGTVTGVVPGHLVQAEIAADMIDGLESLSTVVDVRKPARSFPVYSAANDDLASEAAAAVTSGSVKGEHVRTIKAGPWQNLGLEGAGVKIGIIDFFGEPYLSNAISSGDLPRISGSICRFQGTVCNITDPRSAHGVGVAEVIHDLAPEAELYLATAVTTADTKAVVDYFIANGVDIISRSLTSEYDGAGDGTGPLNSVVDYAVANGIAWFNSAGNNAALPGDYGAYWRGTWVDADNDGWLEFAPGDESMGFSACFMNGLRWSDWGQANATDYDWLIYDNPSGTGNPVFASLDTQGNGQDPLELISGPRCSVIYYMKIRLAAANNGTSGDILEIAVNNGILEYSQNRHSASGPGSDANAKGHMSVGAIDPPDGRVIASYSSQGPSNDGRILPDISGPACLAVTAYDRCFNGTSSSTPAVAGTAALVLGAGIASTPAQLEAYLKTAIADRGAKGADNVYGVGEVVLPALKCSGRAVTILGTVGNDRIDGTSGNDVIMGLGGNDIIKGKGGNDRICGGPGKDQLYGDQGKDIIRGGDGKDLLVGGSGNDKLYGDRNRDTLKGKKGADLLVGGAGGDSLNGGSGKDRCYLSSVKNASSGVHKNDRNQKCETF